MTNINRPAQRWRVTEPQQHSAPSTSSEVGNTMSDTAATTTTATVPPMLPPQNPLSPTPYTTPASPPPPLYLPPPPPPPPVPAFPLTPLLRRATTALHTFTHPNRPFVTLTFAQSLDASLSYAPTRSTPPLLLSSPASLRLTHYLRAIHSALLIGANTLHCDNPSLTCRLNPPATHSPTPVILEGGGAEVTAADHRKAIRHGTWVVVNERGVRSERVGRLWVREGWEGGEGETEKERRVSGLLDAGCRVLILPCSSASSSHIAFSTLLAHLSPHFHSLMVEGGAGVITSLLQCETCVIDQLVLTIAPTLVGGWRSVQSRIGESGVRLYDMSCEMCGDDVILHAFTSPVAASTLLSTDSSTAVTSLSTALSDLSSSFRRTSVRLQHHLTPAVSHVLEPYNSAVYSSLALPPLVLLCHTLLRLHTIRRCLPSTLAQRLDRWTQWRTGLLLPALLLLTHYLVQQWSVSGRYSSVDKQEMRVFPSWSRPTSPTSIVSSLSPPSPLLLPTQPYLLPFTSSSGASRPPLPHLFTAATSHFVHSASTTAATSTLFRASAVLEAIKHNRRQSQNGSSSGGSSGGRRRQQSSKSGSSGGETIDGSSEGEAKEKE